MLGLGLRNLGTRCEREKKESDRLTQVIFDQSKHTAMGFGDVREAEDERRFRTSRGDTLTEVDWGGLGLGEGGGRFAITCAEPRRSDRRMRNGGFSGSGGAVDGSVRTLACCGVGVTSSVASLAC